MEFAVRSPKISWNKFRGKCWLMLEIRNLKATVEKKILNGLNLHKNPEKFMPLMGPNGSARVHYQIFYLGKRI